MLVSVIVPTLNEAETIGPCLEAARKNYAPSEVEIIVADGGSTDGTRARLPGDVRSVQAPTGRASQMNRGASLARGDILVFCHADARLPEGWRELVIEALKGPDVSGGAFQTTYVPARGFLHLLNRWRLSGRMWFAVHGDRAQFMSRSIFDTIGGYPDIPLMEDVEMARALHRHGRIAMVSQRVVTSSRRFLENGPWRQFCLSIRLMFRYLFLKATPEEIARAYRSSREEALATREGADRTGGLYEPGPQP